MRTVLDKRHAIAVEDAAAHSGCGNGARLIAISLLFVIVRRDHLHAPQLDGKRREHRAHTRGEDGEAALKGGRRGIALALGGARGRPMLRIVGKRESPRRIMTSATTMATTSTIPAIITVIWEDIYEPPYLSLRVLGLKRMPVWRPPRAENP